MSKASANYASEHDRMTEKRRWLSFVLGCNEADYVLLSHEKVAQRLRRRSATKWHFLAGLIYRFSVPNGYTTGFSFFTRTTAL